MRYNTALQGTLLVPRRAPDRNRWAATALAPAARPPLALSASLPSVPPDGLAKTAVPWYNVFRLKYPYPGGTSFEILHSNSS